MSLKSSLNAIPAYLPNFAANYTKRFLERGYDRAFQTRFGQWLVGLSPWEKYSIEAFLYALTAILDERLPADSPLRKYVSQVGLDAAPEISKRMVNGAREEIAVVAAAAKNLEEKELLDAVLSLDDRDVTSLLVWLGQTKSQRDEALNLLSWLDPEQKVKFFHLSDEDKEKLLEFFRPQEPSEPTFGQVLRQDLVKGTERLRETKEKMRQRRKGGKQ